MKHPQRRTFEGMSQRIALGAAAVKIKAVLLPERLEHPRRRIGSEFLAERIDAGLGKHPLHAEKQCSGAAINAGGVSLDMNPLAEEVAKADARLVRQAGFHEEEIRAKRPSPV